MFCYFLYEFYFVGDKISAGFFKTKLKIQLWTAETRAVASRKLKVVNIMTTSISITFRTAIAVSVWCAFPNVIFRGLLTVQVYYD